MIQFRTIIELAKESFKEWQKDNAMRLAAALAYYTAFSLAPLMLVILSVAGLAMGKEAATGQIHHEMTSMVGPRIAETLQDLLKSAKDPGTSIFGMISALALGLFGASGVFGELKDSLNIIWGVHPKGGSGVWNFIRGRFLSITMVMGVCFLLLVSTVLSSFLNTFAAFGPSSVPGMTLLLQILTFAVSLAVITALFAMMFKWLPDTDVQWRDVLTGAFCTALLFTVGKSAMEIYFSSAGVASSYGAAGGLALALIWIYYSAQIFFFGAEFTEVYARRRGSRMGKEAPNPEPDDASTPSAAPAAGASPAFAAAAPGAAGLAPAAAFKATPDAAPSASSALSPATAATKPLPPGTVKRLATIGALALTGWAMEKVKERKAERETGVS